MLTVTSLALAGAMVVCALAFETTMDRLATDPSLRAQPWEVAVFTDSMPPEEVDGLLASVPGVEAVGRRYDVLAMANGIELETRVIDGSPSAFAFAVPDGRGVRRAGEVTLGRGALEQLGVEIGDHVTLTADGRRFSARVVGRHVRAGRRRPRRRGVGGHDPGGVAAAPGLGPSGWPTASTPRAPRGEIERLGEGRLLVSRPGESLEREVGEMRPIVSTR